MGHSVKHTTDAKGFYPLLPNAQLATALCAAILRPCPPGTASKLSAWGRFRTRSACRYALLSCILHLKSTAQLVAAFTCAASPVQCMVSGEVLGIVQNAGGQRTILTSWFGQESQSMPSSQCKRKPVQILNESGRCV